MPINKYDIYKKIKNMSCEKALYLLPLFILFMGGSIMKGFMIVPLTYGVLSILIFFLFLKLNKKKKADMKLIICYPVFLSCFQNVYLGIISENISDLEIKCLVVINFIYVVFWSIILYVMQRNTNKYLTGAVIFIVIFSLYAIISGVVNNAEIVSMFASYRNVFSGLFFCVFGYLVCYYTEKWEDILKLLCVFGIIVFLVGIYEIFIDNNLWIRLSIDKLWEHKNMSVATWGLPQNFVSSEKIGGKHIRRMASTFADPVNLGTFLAAIFMIGWVAKKQIIVVLSGIAIVLTVSKGAFMSILIFGAVYVFYRFTNKKNKIISISILFMIGILFLAYAYFFSTGSVIVHISGFLKSITSLSDKKFGYGLGNIGVIANLVGENINPDIVESGLGAIVGQFGFVGLFFYMTFYIWIIMKVISIKEKNVKIFGLSMILSIIANSTFNEVALSPNSCGIYYILLGIMCRKNGKRCQE